MILTVDLVNDSKDDIQKAIMILENIISHRTPQQTQSAPVQQPSATIHSAPQQSFQAPPPMSRPVEQPRASTTNFTPRPMSAAPAQATNEPKQSEQASYSMLNLLSGRNKK
jgi:hypothetical protein